MIRILASPGSFPSARLLKAEIIALTGEKVGLAGRPELLRKAPDIRYGHTGENPHWREIKRTLLNAPSFIDTCSNKLRTSKYFLLDRPESFDFPVFHPCSEVPSKYPVIIRKTLIGSGGIGIVVVRSQAEFMPHTRNGYYWTEFVNLSREYRVHMLGNTMSRIFEKLPTDPNNKDELPIRNLSRGYHFSLLSGTSGFEGLRTVCAELASKMGNYFYGLDIGWNRDTKRYFVIELNSAPGLNEHTANEYAQFICNNI
jgi:hypothetical protein